MLKINRLRICGDSGDFEMPFSAFSYREFPMGLLVKQPLEVTKVTRPAL